MNKQAQPLQANNKPLYTGHHLVILKEGIKDFESTQNIFTNRSGLTVASFGDFSVSNFSHESMAGADVITYDHFGVALISELQIRL